VQSGHKLFISHGISNVADVLRQRMESRPEAHGARAIRAFEPVYRADRGQSVRHPAGPV